MSAKLKCVDIITGQLFYNLQRESPCTFPITLPKEKGNVFFTQLDSLHPFHTLTFKKSKQVHTIACFFPMLPKRNSY